MKVIADVKCYHCGHVSGTLEGDNTEPLTKYEFHPRMGFKGRLPEKGESIRCERCRGPVFLEDVRPAIDALLSIPMPAHPMLEKRRKSA